LIFLEISFCGLFYRLRLSSLHLNIFLHFANCWNKNRRWKFDGAPGDFSYLRIHCISSLQISDTFSGGSDIIYIQKHISVHGVGQCQARGSYFFLSRSEYLPPAIIFNTRLLRGTISPNIFSNIVHIISLMTSRPKRKCRIQKNSHHLCIITLYLYTFL